MTNESPPPLQIVHLHIWGIAHPNHKTNICRVLEGMKFTLKTEYSTEKSFQPGGVQIMNVPWGNMPSGLPYMLASYGLNMSWITPPVGDEPLGTWLSHAGTEANIAARSLPPHTTCDKAAWRSTKQGDPNKAATALFNLSQRLGTHWALSAHDVIQADIELIKSTQANTLCELLELASTATTH